MEACGGTDEEVGTQRVGRRGARRAPGASGVGRRKLLGGTDQYSNFAELATDSGSNIRCLDNKREPAVKKGTSKSVKSGPKTKNFKAGEEFEEWIPEEAFRIAHDFRNKSASQTSVSLMN